MSKSIPLVLFNASVVLAGIKSPSGGSAKILSFCKEGKIIGLMSEVMVDEAMRNGPRVGAEPKDIEARIQNLNIRICPAPKSSMVDKFKKIVIDLGDAHVLASANEQKVNFLVTLDKKHILILQEKISKYIIVSPGELISHLQKE